MRERGSAAAANRAGKLITLMLEKGGGVTGAESQSSNRLVKARTVGCFRYKKRNKKQKQHEKKTSVVLQPRGKRAVSVRGKRTVFRCAGEENERVRHRDEFTAETSMRLWHTEEGQIY